MAKDLGDRTLVAERTPPDSGAFHRVHASLVILQGAEIGRDFRLKRGQLVIGRGPEAEIRVHDDLVSRGHARLESTWDRDEQEPHFFIVDLDSTNHTFVNSRRVDRVELMDGDKIQVGNTVLKFVLLDDIEAKFHEEVRNRISYDQLTGLLTKESLYLALEKELQRCARYRLPLAILMMDLDRFKSVNDTHGHTVGSEVLTEVGRRIRESVRARDVSARYGGEEFVTYLAETNAASGGLTAERIRHVIGSKPFEVDGRSLKVTISIGVSAFPDHGADLETLVKRADSALYRAKSKGRDRVCIEKTPSGGRQRAPRSGPRRRSGRRAKRAAAAGRARRPRAGGRSASRRRRSG